MKQTAQVLLSTALVLTATLFAEQTQATPLTFSTSGTIGYGYDQSGTFFGGIAKNNLAGLNFTMVTTIDPALQAVSVTDGSTVNEEYGYNEMPYSETVTINGIAQTFSGVTEFSQTYLNIDGQVHGGGNLNQAAQGQYGYTADNSYLYGEQNVYGPGNLGLGLSFDQIWSYTPQLSDFQFTEFQLSGSDGDVYFYVDDDAYDQAGNLTNISINESNSTVPEPSSIALLGAALLGFVVVRRRRNQLDGFSTVRELISPVKQQAF